MSTKTAITWEEFLAAGEEGQRWEWVDGEVEFMSPVNLRHEAFLALLMEFLVRYCRAHADWICHLQWRVHDGLRKLAYA